jgi:transcriptional regulator with XRE-family HTH domain
MLGAKIYECRKKNGMSQEMLAEKLNVARQTVSNWETGETSPNPEQLKMLSNIFNISVDELLDNKPFMNVSSNSSRAREIGFEYKSKRMFNGVPMIHINLGGIVPRRAKGIIAIGDIAVGVIAMGGVSAGVVSVGGVSAGLVSLGGLAAGLIVALGGLAVAPIALGGLAIGVIACGGAALGYITNLK